MGRAELALDFQRTAAASAELHVEGRNFYPPMLADIASASSSVHINQFGFRPGLDRRPVRRGADREGARGSSGQAERRSTGLRSRRWFPRVLRAADPGGSSGVRDARHEAAGAARPARCRWRDRLEPERVGAYRPSQGRGRRRPDRLGRGRGNRGSLRERRLSRPVRSRRRADRGAAAARVRREPPLARRRDPTGDDPGALPDARRRPEHRSRPSCSTTHRAGSGRSRPRSRP